MVEYLVKNVNNALKSTGARQSLFKLDDRIMIKANLDIDVMLISKQNNGKYECVTYDVNGFVQKTEYMSKKDVEKLVKEELLND